MLRASAGVFQPSILRGLLFRVAATAAISSADQRVWPRSALSTPSSKPTPAPADKSLGAPPAQGAQQRVELIDRTDPRLRQIHPPLVQHRQRVHDLRPASVARRPVARRHRRRRRHRCGRSSAHRRETAPRSRAVAVVGTSTTSSPRASSQDVRCRPSPSATPLRPLLSPSQHPAVLTQARLDADRGDLLVGAWGDRRGGVGALVRVDANQHHRKRVPSVGSDRDPRLTINRAAGCRRLRRVDRWGRQ